MGAAAAAAALMLSLFLQPLLLLFQRLRNDQSNMVKFERLAFGIMPIAKTQAVDTGDWFSPKQRHPTAHSCRQCESLC